MMQEATIVKPSFASEAEEAEWYVAHPDYILQQLQKAEAEGKLTHGTVAKRLGLKSSLSTPFVISREDMELASEQAESKGLHVQAYVKSLLHDALITAGRQTPSS